MKLTIYYGTEKPFVAIGKHQCKLLDFAFNNPSWHTFNPKCRDTKRALWALHLKSCIVFNAFDQFKINLGVNVL